MIFIFILNHWIIIKLEFIVLLKKSIILKYLKVLRLYVFFYIFYSENTFPSNKIFSKGTFGWWYDRNSYELYSRFVKIISINNNTVNGRGSFRIESKVGICHCTCAFFFLIVKYEIVHNYLPVLIFNNLILCPFFQHKYILY